MGQATIHNVTESWYDLSGGSGSGEAATGGGTGLRRSGLVAETRRERVTALGLTIRDDAQGWVLSKGGGAARPAP